MGRDVALPVASHTPSDFNPLSPHGERRAACRKSFPITTISIHSPRMGRDYLLRGAIRPTLDFNPLSPHGERPFPAGYGGAMPFHFNPLSPHGERRVCEGFSVAVQQFQSTLPAWGETERESDEEQAAKFQSTLPAWGETVKAHPEEFPNAISIHSPRMGRDSKRTQLFEEKNWRICTTLYLFASKGVLPADKKTF